MAQRRCRIAHGSQFAGREPAAFRDASKKWHRERSVSNELFSPRSSVGLAFDRGMEDNHDVVYLRLYFFAVTLRISRISWPWKEKLISEVYTG